MTSYTAEAGCVKEADQLVKVQVNKWKIMAG
jgi:hypothetical protein